MMETIIITVLLLDIRQMATTTWKNSSWWFGQTYNNLQWSIIAGDTEWLQQTVTESSGSWSVIIITLILLFVSVASIIETGTFFGILAPTDFILSTAIIVFIGMKQWWMVAVVALCSIVFTVVGDQLWYITGKKLWATLYDKEDTWYFKKKYFLEAQETLTKRWDKILYIGRFLTVWWFLPTIYGVMNLDRKNFIKVSLLSSIIWTLSLVIPLVLLMVLFPSVKYHLGILLLVIYTLPEIIGRIILLRPQDYVQKIANAKEQIASIRWDISDISKQIWSIVEKIKTSDSIETPTETTNESTPNMSVVPTQEQTNQIPQIENTIPIIQTPTPTPTTPPTQQ